MPSNETMETIEKTLDVVEDTLETVERIPKVHLNGTTRRQQYIILGVTAAVSLAAGGGVSHILTKRHLKLKYEAIAEQEVADAKKYYAARYKKDEFADATSALEELVGEDNSEEEQSKNEFTQEALDQKVSQLRYSPTIVSAPVDTEEELVEDPEPVVRNIFTDAKTDPDDFDYDEEAKKRSADAPYVISHDEFYQNETDSAQVTLTYYVGDDVLVDEREQPVSDADTIVGDDNLQRFGHGSKDANIVYVRNEHLDTDFEVVRHEGDYVKEVLGFIEHSDHGGKIRRFRSDRE